MTRNQDFYLGLINELKKLENETPWVEFKRSISDPQIIGQYISALSNGAALSGKAFAYMVWGLDDQTHEIVGTTFKPLSHKKGNEELESWLLRLLSPRIHFMFHSVEIDKTNIVILEIERAFDKPVRFKGTEYIRIGSNKKLLRDFPEKERELWRIFDKIPFEAMVAMEKISDADVITLLDYPAYFDLLEVPLPENRQSILKALADEGIIRRSQAGGWDITNFGAILFARKLSDFKHLSRKAMRVIVYRGNNKYETFREQLGTKGYASGFEGLIGFIDNLLPRNEVMGKALRKDLPVYPEIAVRELVANAIIHQDFSIRGTGPMIEIYSDRMEITNPGIPLVQSDRFLDSPPRSRNESIASFMRRIGVCEERGSGFDKVVYQTEFYQLPPPLIEVAAEHTRVVLFAHKPFNRMDKEEKMRACYLHACLKYVNREYMTNSSLRQRFGILEHNSSLMSRIIKDSVNAGLIRPYDPETAPRYMKYVPIWA